MLAPEKDSCDDQGMGRIIAGVCFWIVIPTVVSMMWPEIDPAFGWGLIVFSAAFGAGAMAIGFWPSLLSRTPLRWRASLTASAAAVPDLMPLIEIRDEAKRRGWDMTGKTNLHVMDFGDGLRQAAVFSQIPFWGRSNRNEFDRLNRNEPLDRVPSNHWKDYEIEIQPFIFAAENFAITTCCPRNDNWKTGSFLDLQVERQPALRWLALEAPKVKGRRER